MHLNVEPLANREFLFKGLKIKAYLDVFKKKKPLVHPPFITVSREPGSGGRHIAKHLAQHLNYKFFDKDIIDTLFKKSASTKLYEDLYDEKEISAIDEMVNTIIYPQLESQDKFVKELVKFITGLTLKGRCVILGRGANFFTDHKFGFHVRITAPLEFRIAMTTKYESMGHAKAADWVKKVSRERNKFVEKYFTHRIDDSEHYDLVLNRAYFSIDEATNLILNAFKKKVKI